MTEATEVRPGMLAVLREVSGETAAAAARHCEATTPGLADLPGRARAAGLGVIRCSVDLHLALAASGRGATPEEEAPLRDRLRTAAERGIPLDVQLMITRRTIAFTLHRYWLLAGPDHTDAMLDLSAGTARFHRRMEQVAVDAWCRLLGGERIASSVRSAYAEALLSGSPPPPTGGTVPPLAREYLLVVLPGRAATARSRFADDPRVLHTVRDGHDVVLVPEGPAARAVAEELSCVGRGDAGPAVAVQTAPADVPAAHAQALDLLALAPSIGASPVLVTPDDALPERLLAGDDEVAGRLVALLDRLDAHPGLRETVEVFLDCDLDRSATAERLHVHRRTLTQRLHRIRSLTGYDPRTSRGVQVLGLARSAAGVRNGHR